MMQIEGHDIVIGNLDIVVYMSILRYDIQIIQQINRSQVRQYDRIRGKRKILQRITRQNSDCTGSTAVIGGGGDCGRTFADSCYVSFAVNGDDTVIAAAPADRLICADNAQGMTVTDRQFQFAVAQGDR